MTHYDHTQMAWWIPLVMVPIAAIIAVAVWFDPATPRLAAALALLPLLIGGQFLSLRVAMDDRRLSVRYGPGLIRFSWPLNEIQSCEQVRNQARYGWGIRGYPGGWLFNISGLDAVEIVFKDGRKRRIGTDEPEPLETAINQAIGRTNAAPTGR